jgi:hypothetical protein
MNRGPTGFRTSFPHAIAFAACLLALLIALPTVSTLVTAGTQIEGAAGTAGYDPSAVYVALVVLAALTLGLFAVLPQGTRPDEITRGAGAPEAAAAAAWPTRGHAVELFIVAALAMIAYFPPFLAKYGTYLEDSYFLTVLHRMQFGQQPYADFEFQYGPLMIMPAYWWTQIFGYSMQAYYWFLAALEAIQYALLMLMLQLFIKQRSIRLGAFVLLVGLLFNDNLGLSWNGLRRFLPVFILTLFALRGGTVRGLAAVSILLGLLGAYSPEYGAACGIAIAAGFAAIYVNRPRQDVILRGLGVFAGAAAVWGVACLVTTGMAFPEYVRATAALVRQRAGGEAAFPFHWSLNSLAVFSLLLVSCAAVGRGLSRWREADIQDGDLLILCGLVYALIGMKSGLARSDMYHLVAPMLGLAVAYVLPVRRALIPVGRATRRAAIVLVGVIWITYVPGMSGIGLAYLKGWTQGARDTLIGTVSGRISQAEMPGPSIELERSHPRDYLLSLGAHLTTKMHDKQMLLYYGNAWGLDKLVGVPKTVYVTDDYLMSDSLGTEIRDSLASEPDALVLMTDDEYRYVFESAPSPTYSSRFLFGDSPLAQVLRYVSSTHYGQAVQVERESKAARWERTVGSYVRDNFVRTETFGPLVLLERADL